MWWLKRQPRRVIAMTVACVLLAHAGVAAQSSAPREAELAAKESRLALWEDDLNRRAQGDAYFDNLAGYITPRELARTGLLTFLFGVISSVLLAAFLNRRGLLGTHLSGSRNRELERTEQRVLSGLSELDQLLDRFHRAMDRDSNPKKSGMRIARAKPRPASEADEDAVVPAPPLAAVASVASMHEAEGEGPEGGWLDVIRLAKTGLDSASIAERLRLHPSEVEFILKVDSRR